MQISYRLILNTKIAWMSDVQDISDIYEKNNNNELMNKKILIMIFKL